MRAIGLLFVLGLSGVEISSCPYRALRPLAIGLFVVGFALFALSFPALGRSLRVGLPTDETRLRTGGVYRFSRHPIYVGIYLISFAAVLWHPHWAVIASAAVTILVHHRIARAEEAFLEGRFGAEWLAYKAKVRMYL